MDNMRNLQADMKNDATFETNLRQMSLKMNSDGSDDYEIWLVYNLSTDPTLMTTNGTTSTMNIAAETDESMPYMAGQLIDAEEKMIEEFLCRDQRLFRDYYKRVICISMFKLTEQMIRDTTRHSLILLYLRDDLVMRRRGTDFCSNWVRRMSRLDYSSTLLLTHYRMPDYTNLRYWFQEGIGNFLLRPLSCETIRTIGLTCYLQWESKMAIANSVTIPRQQSEQLSLISTSDYASRKSRTWTSEHVPIGATGNRLTQPPIERRGGAMDRDDVFVHRRPSSIVSIATPSSLKATLGMGNNALWVLEDFVRFAFPVYLGSVSSAACLRHSSLSSMFTMSEEDATRLSRSLNSWDFDVYAYSIDELTFLAWRMFMGMGAGSLERLNLDALQRFLVAVRTNYRDNPYHNFYHAVDALQACYYMTRGSFQERTGLRSIDLLALAVAIYCHDVGHPGVNNIFMKKSVTSLALLYNDRSILENYHCTVTFSLLRQHELDFMAKWSHEQRDDFRSSVINTMTDMALHVNFVQRWQECFGTEAKNRHLIDNKASITNITTPTTTTATSPRLRPSTVMISESRRHLLLAAIVKSADISNPARPFPIAHRWAYQILEERRRQDQLERQISDPVFLRGLITTGSSGSSTTTSTPVELIHTQSEFIRITVLPFYELVFSVLGDLDEAITNLRRNQEIWRQAERYSAKRWSMPLPDRDTTTDHIPSNGDIINGSSSGGPIGLGRRRSSRRGVHARRFSLPIEPPRRPSIPIAVSSEQQPPMIAIEIPSVSIVSDTHEDDLWQPHYPAKRRRSLPTDILSEEAASISMSDIFNPMAS
jgi:hypothetical protein